MSHDVRRHTIGGNSLGASGKIELVLGAEWESLLLIAPDGCSASTTEGRMLVADQLDFLARLTAERADLAPVRR